MDPNSPQQPPQYPQYPNVPPQYGQPPVPPQPLYAAPPAYGAPQPYGAPAQGGASGMSIAGLITAFFFPLVGLILSIIGYSQAKKTNQSRGVALAGIIVSSVLMVLTIPIILAIIFASFSGVQSKARNVERETDIKALQGQVESYYNSKDEYPTLENMNDANWRATNLPGLDQLALQDPASTDYELASVPRTHVYAYQPTASDGASCDNDKYRCTSYTLTATYDGVDAGTYTRSNIN